MIMHTTQLSLTMYVSIMMPSKTWTSRNVYNYICYYVMQGLFNDILLVTVTVVFWLVVNQTGRAANNYIETLTQSCER